VIRLLKLIFLISLINTALVAKNYWWNQKAIGIIFGHGGEENRYDR